MPRRPPDRAYYDALTRHARDPESQESADSRSTEPRSPRLTRGSDDRESRCKRSGQRLRELNEYKATGEAVVRDNGRTKIRKDLERLKVWGAKTRVTSLTSVFAR